MSFAVAPPDQVSVPIRNSLLRFPVRRIYCVGRNYDDHVAEMGGVPGREPPFFFQKPADAILLDGKFPYPSQSSNVHYEVELVVVLQSGGRNIPLTESQQHIFGYAVGLDMTRRDLQAEMKKLGRPWEVAKSFDYSAPMSAIAPKSETGVIEAAQISLSVNGAVRQDSDVSKMIWNVPEIISELSRLFDLHAGDIIFTGTPSGVGPVQIGDSLVARITGVGEFSLQVCTPS